MDNKEKEYKPTSQDAILSIAIGFVLTVAILVNFVMIRGDLDKLWHISIVILINSICLFFLKMYFK